MDRTKNLVAKIKLWGKLSYDGVMDEAYKIDPAWREDTIRRSLRKQSCILAIGVDKTKEPSGQNPIGSFRYVNPPKIFNKNKKLKVLGQKRLFRPKYTRKY